ncbi:MAG TPA: SDR family NAD(P)-dependent oxidoreductase [Anaeromyxobacter sp.]|nr:SDR family NAD(P)-dependent oxidoreductase [Anaeromyxobacter sp.]
MATGERPLALVTGASDGIGYELARELAERGYDLVVCAEDPGIAEAGQAFEAKGARVERVQADLATHTGVETLYDRVRSVGRPLEAAAINAGIGVNGDFARETDLDAELKLIALNVTGAVHLAKLVLRDMVAHGRGRLLFTSSIAALMPAPFEAVYGASKAFLYSFSEAVRNELKDTGITVTALLPGPTDTSFFERADMEDTKAGAGRKDDPADVARDALEAMLAGKDRVVAGSFRTKAQAAAARVLSEPQKAQLHRGLTEPGSADK